MKYGKMKKPSFEKSELKALILEARKTSLDKLIAIKKRSLGTEMIKAAQNGRELHRHFVSDRWGKKRIPDLAKILRDYAQQSGFKASIQRENGHEIVSVDLI